MAIDLSKYGEPVKTSKVNLASYGTPIAVEEAPKKDGFFKGVYKSLASPVVNLLARPVQLAETLITNKAPFEGKVLGVDVTAPKTGKDVLKDVGAGLETVAMGIGGGGVGSTLKTGLKEGLKSGLKEGAVLGLKTSPLFGVGDSLAQGNTDIKTILKDAAISTAIGVPTTAALGTVAPLAKGVVNKFTQNNAREELGNIFRTTASKYVKPQAILDQAQQVSKTDPIAVLQMYGKNIIPDMKGGGADTIEGQAFLKKKIGELSQLRNEELFLNTERVPLGGYRQYANELLDAQNWSVAKKESARKDLNKILQQIENAYKDSPKNVNGIELNELGIIKTEQTGLSKSYNNKTPKFDYDAHAIAGKAARDLVELLDESGTSHDLNKLIQSHYDAIDLLDAINGKKVHGGALSKSFLKLGGDVVGAVAGNAVGQPFLGAVAGHAISGKIADIVQNKFITNPVKRLLINNLKEQSPKEVNAVLKSLETKYQSIFEDLGLSYSSPSNAKMLSKKTITTNPSTNNIPPTVPQTPNKSIPNKQGGFIQTNLTTKILKDLEGKGTVSKQYILDATNRGDVKQVEKDVIRDMLTKEGDKVNATEFANKVKAELLPLKRTTSDINANPDIYNTGAGKYENIALPDELRGSVKKYNENVYQSPIKTSAGGTHFSESSSPNYFGHTRVEDMADNKTRRVIEVQSDLYQKGNLEKEINRANNEKDFALSKEKAGFGKYIKTTESPETLTKLQQYNDPTAHFRMVREEIQKASQDGKTKLQFPTGETAMKIEGLGQGDTWQIGTGESRLTLNADMLNPKMIGETVRPISQAGDAWIITDVLGDGKFKAVPRDYFDNYSKNRKLSMAEMNQSSNAESFDISGKVDTNNPIYKFYEKDLQKYLNRFGGKQVVDSKGISWIEVSISKEQSGSVEAFGKIAKSPLLIGAGATGAIAGANKLAQIPKTSTYERPKDEVKTVVKKDPTPTPIQYTLMGLESSGGKDTRSQDKGEMKWLTGLTDIAIKEMKRVGLIKDIDVNNKAQVLDASEKFFNLLKKRHPNLSDAEVYADHYWNGWKNLPNPKKARENAINKFNKLHGR